MSQKFHSKKLLPGLKSLDMFGYTPQLNLFGQSAVTTRTGAFISAILYGLMITNFIQLSVKFNNGEKQNESFVPQLINRFDAGPHYFKDNQFDIAIVHQVPLPEELGTYVANLIEPCTRDDGNCEFKERIKKEVPFHKCTGDKLQEITEYWVKRKGIDLGQKFADNAMCLDVEDFYLAGEPATNLAASLIVRIKPRDDFVNAYQEFYNNLNITEDEDYLENSTFVLKYGKIEQEYLSYGQAQIHFAQSQPKIKTGTSERVVKVFFTSWKVLELSRSIMVNRDDYLGLIDSEPDEQSFFQIEKELIESPFQTELKNTFPRFSDGLQQIQLELHLSDLEKTYEREVYSFMAFLGDFGGFNDGVIILPAILLSFYAEKMFNKTLYSNLPIKTQSNKQSRSKMSRQLQENLSFFELTQLDCESLAEESQRIKMGRNTWCTSLFSCILCFCKKDRGILMQERAIEHFEKQLDIRSLVKTRIDLSILLSLLLSKQQQLLFKNQHARVFATSSSIKQPSKNTIKSLNEPVDSFLNPEMFKFLAKSSLKDEYEKTIMGFKVQTELDRKLLLGIWSNNEVHQQINQRSKSSIQVSGLENSVVNQTSDQQLVQNWQHQSQNANNYHQKGENMIQFEDQYVVVPKRKVQHRIWPRREIINKNTIQHFNVP